MLFRSKRAKRLNVFYDAFMNAVECWRRFVCKVAIATAVRRRSLQVVDTSIAAHATRRHRLRLIGQRHARTTTKHAVATAVVVVVVVAGQRVVWCERFWRWRRRWLIETPLRWWRRRRRLLVMLHC